MGGGGINIPSNRSTPLRQSRHVQVLPSSSDFTIDDPLTPRNPEESLELPATRGRSASSSVSSPFLSSALLGTPNHKRGHSQPPNSAHRFYTPTTRVPLAHTVSSPILRPSDLGSWVHTVTPGLAGLNLEDEASQTRLRDLTLNIAVLTCVLVIAYGLNYVRLLLRPFGASLMWAVLLSAALHRPKNQIARFLEWICEVPDDTTSRRHQHTLANKKLSRREKLVRRRESFSGAVGARNRNNDTHFFANLPFPLPFLTRAVVYWLSAFFAPGSRSNSRVCFTLLSLAYAAFVVVRYLSISIFLLGAILCVSILSYGLSLLWKVPLILTIGNAISSQFRVALSVRPASSAIRTGKYLINVFRRQLAHPIKRLIRKNSGQLATIFVLWCLLVAACVLITTFLISLAFESKDIVQAAPGMLESAALGPRLQGVLVLNLNETIRTFQTAQNFTLNEFLGLDFAELGSLSSLWQVHPGDKAVNLSDDCKPNRTDHSLPHMQRLIDVIHSNQETFDVVTFLWKTDWAGVLEDALEMPRLLFDAASRDKNAVQSITNYAKSHVQEISSALKATASILLSLLVQGVLLASDYAFSILVFFGALYQLLVFRVHNTSAQDFLEKRLPFPEEVNHKIASATHSAVKGVFVLALKMFTFNMLYTWLVCTLCGVRYFVLATSILSGVMAVCPIISIVFVTIPGILELVLVGGLTLNAMLLFLAHLILPLTIHPIIYKEVRHISPTLVSWSVVFGLYAFQLEGVLLGPMIACVPVISFRLYEDLMQQDTKKVAPSRASGDVRFSNKAKGD